MIRARSKLVFTLFLLLFPLTLGAQEDRLLPPSAPADPLTVSLVTIGQGDLVWERFGHNALLFQDRVAGTEIVYHWGIFNFFSEDFVPRLIQGTMLYSMGPSDFIPTLLAYEEAGRPVWIQELALTASQERELLALVEENYRPENRDYRYDYYRDNCSTRLRDALDHVLGGAIEASFSTDTTEHSFRWQTRRILREMPVYYLGIQFVLGPSADRPITVWEEMFLPRTLMRGVREIRVPDGSGGSRPLVVEEGEVVVSRRPEVPSSPPFAFPIFLFAGILLGGILLWSTRRLAQPVLSRRVGALVFGGGWSLVAALGGTLLLGAWLFTDHRFWYANFNLFQVNPLFFPLVFAFLSFSIKGRFPRWAGSLAVVLGSLSALGLLLELLPGVGQNNGEILALTLPINLAIWWGIGRRPPQGNLGPVQADGKTG